MFYVYFLRSLAKPGTTYVGFTQLDPTARLAVHNRGAVPVNGFDILASKDRRPVPANERSAPRRSAREPGRAVGRRQPENRA